MWDDPRLTAALAALPPEAFIDGPPEDGELVWRRVARRLRDGNDPPEPDTPAPVLDLRRDEPSGR